jgi:LysM repeat protein
MPNGNCPNGMPYTIKSGDTFYNIARTYGISLDTLLAANPGINPNRLHIGQVICVPNATPTPPPTNTCPLLRQGSTGEAVRDLQTRLRNAGFDPGNIDGVFGAKTHSAVINFQRNNGLTPDGLVGVLTWTALGVNCSSTPSPVTCPAGSFEYTIRAGDTFFVLAERYNTTVSAIQHANPNVNPNALQIGQKICIPRT